MIILAPISVGELVDKITILMIKQQRITNLDKLKNINHELAQLMELLNALPRDDFEKITDMFSELLAVNNELWNLENYKRACEQTQNFDLVFIETARNVYLKNDDRARIKREINLLTGSDIVEVKDHPTA